MELTPAWVQQLQQLFELALEIPEERRRAFLDQQCGGDPVLRDEVLALVAVHETGATLARGALAPARGDGCNADPVRWLGVRLGAWRVVRLVGQGGMGTVYEAVRADDQFEKRVAMKFLHADARTALAAHAFRAERQILASLDHPSVTTLLDGGVTRDGQPYLVMEYIDGEPITAWADARGLSPRARVELFLQACAGVEAAHRSLVVHCDLKPGNILVTADGRVKLLDFGIARMLGEVSPGADPQALSFTPGYAAPEQVRGLVVTTAADVYSLGVVLLRLLTGRLPDEGQQGIAAIARMSGLAPDLASLIVRATQAAPYQRYASVQELRTDLQHWLAGLPVAAHGGGRSYRVGKFLRRHRVGSAVLAAALAGVLVASAVALRQSHVAQQAAADQRELNGFLMEVLAMSDPFSEGDDLTLATTLDMAAAGIERRFANRPDLSAQIRFGIGTSMANRYRLEQADVQLRRALQESLAAFGAQDVRTLRVIDGIAGLALDGSRFAEAEAGYRQVIEVLESRRATADPLYVTVLGNLGNVYLQQERYADADQVLRRAEAAQAAPGGQGVPEDHANLLSNLAHAAHGLEDHARADHYYDEAEAAVRALYPDGSPDLAILYNNHVLLHEDRGNLAEALALQRESLALRRRIFRNRHPLVVSALGSIARLALRAGDTPDALAYAAEGAALADELYTEPDRMHPSIHATLAAAQLAEGLAEEAGHSWLRAHQLLQALPQAPPSIVAWVEEVRGRLCDHAPDRCPVP